MEKQEKINKQIDKIHNKLMPLVEELSEIGKDFKINLGYGEVIIKFQKKASEYFKSLE